jgi:ornithine cyclodeaminase/alanine dehydrogenase-like protein (mu-crystallin family)
MAGEGTRLLYLSRRDVEAVGLTMAEVIEAVEGMFREKGEGRVEMPPKPGIHTQPDAFIHAMPAYIPAFHSAGIKWVSGYPDNQKKGLPYISGLLILNDPETGIPLSVMDCTWITAMRTGAASAVAAKYLARPESQTLGVLGCGVQGRSNLAALREVLPLRRVYAYDTNGDALKRYVRDMAERFGLEVIPVGEPRQAVIGCDVVVTAGPILKHPAPAIEAGWLREGGLACPVDFDSYWQPGALAQMDKLCTDDIPQLLHYRDIGYFQSIPPLYADLGEIVTGRKPGRERADERIMAMNLGLALEDMAVAPLVYQRALDRGIGAWLSL